MMAAVMKANEYKLCSSVAVSHNLTAGHSDLVISPVVLRLNRGKSHRNFIMMKAP